MYKGATMLTLALAFALSACEDATGPGGGSRLQVMARGDDAPASQSVAPSEGGSYSHTSAEGTVHFRAQVYVYSSTQGWVELTNQAAQSAVVDASGHGAASTFASGSVAAGSYTRVRVVFEEVDANLSGSLLVSSGWLSGSVSVNMESDNQVVVERQVSVNVSGSAVASLLINLNASAWLNSASASSRTVSEAAFASAVAITAS